MPIAQRTATSGTAGIGAGFSVTLPTGTTTGDFILVAIANAGAPGPATPTGWTKSAQFSAGSAQSISIYSAQYSAGLTLSFTNANTLAAWCCNSYFQAGSTLGPDGVFGVAASSTSNNATMPTGAPVTGPAGDYEVLAYAWTSAATISGVAAGTAIDKTQANSTTISVALGRNTTASLGAGATPTAFSQTLSATNTRKTGVGILLKVLVYKNLTGSAGGSGSASGAISKILPIVYKNLTGSAAGRGQVGTAFLWGGGGQYGTAVWGATGVTVITGGPPPPGPKYITGTAAGTSTVSGEVTRQAGPKNIVGTAAGVATVTASLSRRRALTAASAGVASVSALLTRRRALGASAAGMSTTAGAVTARRSLTGTATGNTTAVGFVDKAGSVFKNLFGTSAGKATVAGQPTRRRALTALSAGVATTSLALGRKRALVALTAGVATVTALLTRRRALTALSAGRATVTALISRRRAVTGLSAGQATTTALIQKKRSLGTGLAVGQATTSGVIDKITIPLTSVIWVGDHFEQGVIGTLILWDTNQFQTDGEYAQVIWEDDVFKVYP